MRSIGYRYVGAASFWLCFPPLTITNRMSFSLYSESCRSWPLVAPVISDDFSFGTTSQKGLFSRPHVIEKRRKDGFLILILHSGFDVLYTELEVSIRI